MARAQRFPARWSAHFSLFALVTAGRDEGSGRFEQAALAEHLCFAVAGLRAAGLSWIQVALTPLPDAGMRITAAVTEKLAESGVDAGGEAVTVGLCAGHQRFTGCPCPSIASGRRPRSQRPDELLAAPGALDQAYPPWPQPQTSPRVVADWLRQAAGAAYDAGCGTAGDGGQEELAGRTVTVVSWPTLG